MATYAMPVAKRVQETDDTVSLFFTVPVDLRTTFEYRVGQFLTIVDDPAGEEISRQYSLSSVPGLDPQLRITVKRIDGGAMSTYLVERVAEGDLLEISPPRGRLYVPQEEPEHHLFISAGSGVAPLVAIARFLVDRASGDRLTFVCGNRTPESIILRDEVDALAKDGALVEHVLSRANEEWTGARGRIGLDYLTEHWDRWCAEGEPTSAFLCGPEPFMDVAQEFLLGRGVELSRIRRESFDLVLNDDDDPATDLFVPEGADAPDAHAAPTVTAVVGGETVEVVAEPGEPLLTALLRADADVPFSCQEGTCSSCIVKLGDGRVRIREGVLATLRPDDLAEGLILACLSRAVTSTVHIDFDDI